MTLRCNTFVRYREIWHPHSWEYTELSQKKTHAGRCKPGGGCRNVRLHAQHHSSTRRMGEGRDNPPQFPNSYAGWLDYRPADWVFLRDLWLRMVISVVSAKDLSGARPAGCWNDDFLLVKRARGQRAKLKWLADIYLSLDLFESMLSPHKMKGASEQVWAKTAWSELS